MPNALEALQNWLLHPPPIFQNIHTTVPAELFTWSQYAPPPGPPEYNYIGMALPTTTTGGAPGLSVAATLYGGNLPLVFVAAMFGDADGQVSLEDLKLQSPDYSTTGILSSGPTVMSTDSGQFIELDFQVSFPTATFPAEVECHLLLQQSGRLIVTPKKVTPIK
jgi:hypothetical protein